MARKEELTRMWERTLDYLFNQRPAFEREGATGYKPGLDTSLALDKMYGKPHRNYRIIHIAGTNGKGSTAHMLASCLQQCGYRVGLFTSPHLVDFRERILVNGKKVSRNYVMKWVADYREHALEDYEPSFFELTSTMAFDYFSWRHVNVAVIETGLGGRLDSTNIITPEVSVITNIGLEHQQFLGNTLEEITSEKAGIIKPRIPVIVGHADGVVRTVIERAAKSKKSEATFAQDKPEVLNAVHVDGMLRLSTASHGVVDCQLTGDYQVENVNTVLHTLNLLKSLNYRIKEDAIIGGLSHVVENTGLMGRWMRLGEKPLLLCDSAHNPHGFEQVMRQLKGETYEKLHLVLGFMADKDVNTMLRLLPKNARYYFTQAQTTRSMKCEELQQNAASMGLQGGAYSHVKDALESARRSALPKDLIYVGGSMYVLSDLLKYLGYGD